MSEGEGYKGTNLNPIFCMASPVQSAASETGAPADVRYGAKCLTRRVWTDGARTAV